MQHGATFSGVAARQLSSTGQAAAHVGCDRATIWRAIVAGESKPSGSAATAQQQGHRLETRVARAFLEAWERTGVPATQRRMATHRSRPRPLPRLGSRRSDARRIDSNGKRFFYFTQAPDPGVRFLSPQGRTAVAGDTVVDFDAILADARRNHVCAQCGEPLASWQRVTVAFCSPRCRWRFRDRRDYAENPEREAGEGSRVLLGQPRGRAG